MMDDEFFFYHASRKGFQIMRQRRKYGFFAFMGDIIMTALTGGLWLIWIFVREMRNR